MARIKPGNEQPARSDLGAAKDKKWSGKANLTKELSPIARSIWIYWALCQFWVELAVLVKYRSG